MSKKKYGNGIYKQDNGKYGAIVSLGNDPLTGKRLRKHITGKNTLDEIEYEVMKLRIKYLEGEITTQLKVPFIEVYFNFMESHKKTVKKTTFDNFEGMCNLHILPYFENNKNIRDVKLIHIEEFVETLKLKSGKKIGTFMSANRINKIIVALGQIFRHGMRMEVINKNPMELVRKLPEQKPEEKEILEPEQVIRLLNSIDETSSFTNLIYKTFLSINYGCGLRLSEIAGIKKDKIFIEDDVMKIKVGPTLQYVAGGYEFDDKAKTNSGIRTVILPKITKVLVQKLLDTSPDHWIWLFQKKENTPPYSQAAYNRFLQKKCREIGLPEITSHNLRHSIASLLVLESNDKIAIKQRMGHSKIEITMNMYGHTFKRSEQNLVDKIDDKFAYN